MCSIVYTIIHYRCKLMVCQTWLTFDSYVQRVTVPAASVLYHTLCHIIFRPRALHRVQVDWSTAFTKISIRMSSGTCGIIGVGQTVFSPTNGAAGLSSIWHFKAPMMIITTVTTDCLQKSAYHHHENHISAILTGHTPAKINFTMCSTRLVQNYHRYIERDWVVTTWQQMFKPHTTHLHPPKHTVTIRLICTHPLLYDCRGSYVPSLYSNKVNCKVK